VRRAGRAAAGRRRRGRRAVVLDVGTGTGTVASLAAARGASVVAVDAEPGMAALTREQFDKLTAPFAVDGRLALPTAAVLVSGLVADRAPEGRVALSLV
jgi:methylase of polypeptide subunit release factors